MSKLPNQSRILKSVLDILENGPTERFDLIDKCALRLKKPDQNIKDTSLGSYAANLRSRIGVVISNMEVRELIAVDEDRKYYINKERPVIVRIDACEKEIIKALSYSPKTKKELQQILENTIGTNKTKSARDDDILYGYIGKILKRMLQSGVVTFTDNHYSLSKKVIAKNDDINEMLSLKSDFLNRLHSKGGEFFENYYMTLLSKFAIRSGKKVTSCTVMGGSNDGGIDGVMETIDYFGFKETIMVQTKNRTDLATETEVRAFYGAVCAKGGSRGIFATTSDFHDMAQKLLEEIDNCVGVCGSKIFSMAIKCSYGIKRNKSFYQIDDKIL